MDSEAAARGAAPQGRAQEAVEAIWRMESSRIIAALLRLTQDLGSAEELAQDALVTALELWPKDGIPANPGGWLMTTAKNRAIDAHRRNATARRKLEELGHQSATRQREDPTDRIVDQLDDYLKDDVLRLVFTACSPALSMEARVALTLKCVAGLSTAEIARTYLVPESTVAQRIVRAKRTLAREQVPLTLPAPGDAVGRIASVLEVVFSIFNEGYSATAGPGWVRPQLCDDALRLGRLVTALVPDHAEAHGLLALMELQASRLPARVDDDGGAVLLGDQDRSRWDRLLIRRGLAALATALELEQPLGPYTVQAAIAACHARARDTQDTDWAQVVAWYDVLAQLWPSPVVELNRAVAVARAGDPEHALAVLDRLAADQQLNSYPHLYAVRGDVLAQLGHQDRAHEAFARAAALTANDQERDLFLRRAGPTTAAIPEGLE